MKCENYTYLQGQVEESLGECSLDTQPSVQSKSNHTAKKSYEQDSGTESCQNSQSLETSENSTGDRGEEQLTFFAEDSPVRTSLRRVKEQELPESVRAYGKSMRDSLERFGLNLSLPKTHLCCELGGLELSSKTLPSWGIMQGGELWELGMSVRPINETGCGFWPTPCRRDYKGSNAPEGLTRKDGKSRLDQLPNAVVYGGTQTQQKWMTPQSRDWKGPSGRAYKGQAKDLPSQTKHLGQLNPSWVEWLMNWPINWTSKEVLRNEHFEYWKKASATHLQGFVYLREMWGNIDPATPPHRPQCNEQQEGEYPGSMCEMPRDASCEGEMVKPQQGENLSLLQRDFHLQEVQRAVLQPELCESLGLGAEETIPRTANGVKNRVDRLKAIGNGQVPQCAAMAFRILSEGLI